MENLELKGNHTKKDFVRLYKKCKDTRLRERYQAMYLSFSFDWKTVAMILERDYETILSWVKSYNERGIEGLESDKPTGRPASLNEEQLKDLKNTVQKSPRNLGMKFSNWNCKNLAWLVKKMFGVVLCAERIRQILHALGFILIKPAYRYVLADKHERKLFLRRFRHKFSRLTKRDLLLFLDESTVKQHPLLQAKWVLQGSKEFVGTFGNHAKTHIFGAVNHVMGKAFHIKSKKLNSDIFMKFIERLMALNPKRHLVLVIDNAPWHTSKKVMSFFERVADKVEIIWLPAYSPDFNPAEHLWKFMKGVVSNFFFPTMKELNVALTDFFRSLYQKKQKIMILCSPNYLLG